jgi:hypothetical protein
VTWVYGPEGFWLRNAMKATAEKERAKK